MSSKKEEKSDAAADRIKAAAMSAAKGLSRAQAERAATAAARNVNAYGQKEEGPSRWQERKEAKRQMYLMSTEKAVKLGERKDLKPNNMSTIGGAASQCQKCFQPGHWTYECKNERVYISRPSRSQILKNPKLRQKLMSSYNEDNADIKGKEEEEEEEEREAKEEKKKPKKKSKRKYRSDTESSSGSEASDSRSDSRSSGTGSDSLSDSASSYSSSSDSENERKRRRKRSNEKQKGHRKRYSSSSESADDESSSDSDSGKKQKSKRRSSRKR